MVTKERERERESGTPTLVAPCHAAIVSFFMDFPAQWSLEQAEVRQRCQRKCLSKWAVRVCVFPLLMCATCAHFQPRARRREGEGGQGV